MNIWAYGGGFTRSSELTLGHLSEATEVPWFETENCVKGEKSS